MNTHELEDKLRELTSARDKIVLELREVKYNLIEAYVKEGRIDLLSIRTDRLVPPPKYR